MASRKKYVGGNWKMNLNKAEAVALAKDLATKVDDAAPCEVAICPPFVYLDAISQALCEAGNKTIKLGAQDFWTAGNGAYTGEISLDMLKDVGVSVVLTGHSERRHVIGETDVLINEKNLKALEAGMEVIFCIGEKLEQREAGQTDAINAAQMSYGLAGVTAEQMKNVVVAYEPVWAIGTGKTATPEDAQKAHKAIREHLTSMFSKEVADGVRIQYGGSMKPSNAGELMGQADIDGGLIGGAALKADDFMGIINAAK
ncbi:Triosephosphate isomerase [Poriferisphaera corsica]|uniref:Triosephosphate isomerase n=1 Tax=Poriferisphaera corsica TaxID=2528020 RepID=A0A517YY84_9BACT|nr:triose-phosphate isomerase [Poriferisphaera corsica]QDU35178.1 Triosephosphate isomerase [Poriferisphaera corsica]